MTYFNLKEFECKCGCGLNNINISLIVKLDTARNTAGIPFIINSGCRCNKHNKAIKGSRKSSHLSGDAVDIKCENSHDRQLILTALIEAGFKRIGIAETFIHVDIDESKLPAIWLYD